MKQRDSNWSRTRKCNLQLVIAALVVLGRVIELVGAAASLRSGSAGGVAVVIGDDLLAHLRPVHLTLLLHVLQIF